MTDSKPISPPELLVYLVDDDPQDVEIAIDALRECRADNRVRIFGNGKELVDAMTGESDDAEPPESPDLILLDLQMPKMNGIETLAWIRQQSSLSKVPVIVFSSVRDQEQIASVFELGGNGFIDKNEIDIDLTESLDILEQYWIGKPADASPQAAHAMTTNSQK